MTLRTPSKWLANLVKESFLREYPIKVIYNSIDTNVFKPTNSNFRKIYHIKNKIIILGVASYWTKRKGLDEFIQLSRMLDDRYAVVMVGLTRKQSATVPECIIRLGRTDSSLTLAKIYTAADIFVNPSKEEIFGMTTLEAVSCGTYSIVYKGTACEEMIHKIGGVAVDMGAENIYKEIIRFSEE